MLVSPDMYHSSYSEFTANQALFGPVSLLSQILSLFLIYGYILL